MSVPYFIKPFLQISLISTSVTPTNIHKRFLTVSHTFESFPYGIKVNYLNPEIYLQHKVLKFSSHLTENTLYPSQSSSGKCKLLKVRIIRNEKTRTEHLNVKERGTYGNNCVLKDKHLPIQ
jgi:hypothetical protein